MSLITINMINKLNASIGTSSSIDDNGKDAVTAPTAGRKIKIKGGGKDGRSMERSKVIKRRNKVQ